MGHRRKAEEPAFLHDVDARGGNPFAFVVGFGDQAVWPAAKTVGIANAGGEDFEIVAVFVAAQNRAAVAAGIAALAIIEVSLGVGFQTGRIGVAIVRRHFAFVIETLIEVGFAVAIQIVQAGDLIAAQDIHSIIHNLQSQRLKQPVAYRRHLRFSSLSSMPLTTQTSPLIEQRAASPFLKKSTPLKRRKLFQGLSSGAVRVSTT